MLSLELFLWAILGIAAIAVIFVVINFATLLKKPEGDNDAIGQEMKAFAKLIRDGAMTFMKCEYKRILLVAAIVGTLITLFVEKWSGAFFMLGMTVNSISAFVGMKGATYANVRVANTARTTGDIGKTMKTALLGGHISGFSVHAVVLLSLSFVMFLIGGINPDAVSTGIIPIAECNPSFQRLSTFMLGYSLIAIFNRAGGGIFTKMMDAAADFAGKNRHNLDEDSKENPGVIGDSVGDNVNDVLGNCSDLGESTMATLGGAIMIAYMFHRGCAPSFITALVIFAIGVNALGLVGSLIGSAFVLLHKSSGKPSRELDLSTWISALFVLAASFGSAQFLFTRVELPSNFNPLSPAFCAMTGILSGIVVGKLTEYYTGLTGKPVRAIAEAARRGTPFVISEGDALGFRSALLPTAVIGFSIMFSYNTCGYYGIAVAAIGMLSFIANTISIDAFGPISDNAGGIASGCKLNESVRRITDQLDALGNTTAAIGKGFAIGSAAFASISLFVNYVNSYSPGVISENLVSVENIVALFLGIATVGVFVDMLTRYTNKGGEIMTDIINKQLDDPAVVSGTKAPDYATCIVQGTQYALKHMTPPALLALAAPTILGLLFGPGFVAAFLLGSIGVSILLAFFYGNSGGAFDNAKKFIEANMLEGEKKGGDAHKAAVNGDIVGDIRKDVDGVSLDILIKLMTTVAITLAMIFAEHHIF